jgi:hypothetical protein
MLLGSIADIAVVSVLATSGILMSPLPGWLVLATLCIVAIYLLMMDFLKVALLRGPLGDVRTGKLAPPSGAAGPA